MDQPVYAEAVYVDGLTSNKATSPNISPRVPVAVSVSNEAATFEFLNNNNWPRGLQQYILKNANKMAYRYFILDDSGSMATNDGKRLIKLNGPTNYKTVSCSR